MRDWLEIMRDPPSDTVRAIPDEKNMFKYVRKEGKVRERVGVRVRKSGRGEYERVRGEIKRARRHYQAITNYFSGCNLEWELGGGGDERRVGCQRGGRENKLSIVLFFLGGTWS
jgi:hypothetical protein